MYFDDILQGEQVNGIYMSTASRLSSNQPLSGHLYQWSAEEMMLSYAGAALCSEGSMFRRLFVPKVLYAEGSIFRRFHGPKVLCAESYLITAVSEPQ